jgi:hypothetical protein
MHERRASGHVRRFAQVAIELDPDLGEGGCRSWRTRFWAGRRANRVRSQASTARSPRGNGQRVRATP